LSEAHLDGERAARIWRTLHQLRSQVEASLSYQQKKPVALSFHRTLNNVITDFEPIAITMPPKPKPRPQQPPEGEAAAG
jgi:hypothetical protein